MDEMAMSNLDADLLMNGFMEGKVASATETAQNYP